MEKEITATEAVRDFSDLLNRIRFRGDHYIIKRSGKQIACIFPFEEKHRSRSLKELESIFAQLPKLEDDLKDFANDLEELWQKQPLLPEGSPWA